MTPRLKGGALLGVAGVALLVLLALRLVEPTASGRMTSHHLAGEATSSTLPPASPSRAPTPATAPAASDVGAGGQAPGTALQDLSPAQRLTTESAAVGADLDTLLADGNALAANNQSAATDLDVLNEDVAGARADDTRTHSDSASARSSAATCGDAATVAADLATGRQDLGALSGDQSALEATLDTALIHETTLQQDWSTLSRDEASAAGQGASGLVRSAQVTAAVSQLNRAGSAAQSHLGAALSTGRSDLMELQSLASDAQRACAQTEGR